MPSVTCSIEECDRKHHSLGHCKLHYTRNVRHGDPLATKYKPGVPSENGPCLVMGCDNPYFSRQMCPMHYQRWRKHGDAALGASSFQVGCSIAGCGKSHYAHGWCSAHFTRNKRHGSPTARLQGEVFDGHKICSQCARDLPTARFREGRGECRTCAKKYIHARRALIASVESDNYRPHEVFARDLWTCQLCMEPMDESLKWPHRYSPSVDHITPLSLGGTNTLANVQGAHLTCNISKGARIPV